MAIDPKTKMEESYRGIQIDTLSGYYFLEVYNV